MLRFAIASLLLAATPVWAADLNCSLTDADGTVFSAVASQTDQGATATLTVNGVSVTAPGPCFPISHGQPFWGASVRCPFGPNEDRIEVYPIFDSNAVDHAPSMGIVHWKNDHVVLRQRSDNCH